MLLLLLRVGAFILLGLALARPSLRWEEGSSASAFASKFGSRSAPIAAAIVIDNSPRMDYQIANKTRLELAKSEARWVLSQLPEDSEVAILSNTRINDTFQVDLFSAVERIERLTLTNEGRTVGESVAQAVRLLNTSELQTKEIYVFTDLTAPGWPRENAPSVQSQLGSIGIYVVDLGVEQPNNSGIVNLNLSGEVLSAQSSLRLDAEIVHYGKPQERVFELITLDPEGNEQRKSSEIIGFSGRHAIRNSTFVLPNLIPGVHQGLIRSTTSDPLPLDDQYYFTIEVQSAWKVLIVAQAPIANTALFYREAIDPGVFRKRGGSSFQSDTMRLDQWKTFPDSKWDQYRAIVFLDPSPLEPLQWKKLADYVSNGHGVGFFLGRKANPIRSFQHPSALEVLGGKPIRQARSEESFFLAPNDLLSPVLYDFRPRGEVEQIPWSLQPVFRYWTFGDFSEGTHVEIPFSDGRAAVFSHSLGQGTVVVCTTPISDSPNEDPWNLLPIGENNWIFVALAEGITRLLVGAGEQSFNYSPGQTARFVFSEGPVPPNLVLALPDGNNTKVQPDSSKRELRFGATDQIGNYRFLANVGKNVEGGFSVNYRKNQLDLTRLDPVVLNEYFGEKKFRIAKDRTEIEIVVARGRTGFELFPLLMLGLCVLFLGEYTFSNRFYGLAEKKN